MTNRDFLENLIFKVLAIVIAIFIYLIFVVYKVLFPSIIISFFTKLSLTQSMLIYIAFIFTFSIIKKLVKK